jgi:hypothetical protein
MNEVGVYIGSCVPCHLPIFLPSSSISTPIQPVSLPSQILLSNMSTVVDTLMSVNSYQAAYLKEVGEKDNLTLCTPHLPCNSRTEFAYEAHSRDTSHIPPGEWYTHADSSAGPTNKLNVHAGCSRKELARSTQDGQLLPIDWKLRKHEPSIDLEGKCRTCSRPIATAVWLPPYAYVYDRDSENNEDNPLQCLQRDCPKFDGPWGSTVNDIETMIEYPVTVELGETKTVDI